MADGVQHPLVADADSSMHLVTKGQKLRDSLVGAGGGSGPPRTKGAPNTPTLMRQTDFEAKRARMQSAPPSNSARSFSPMGQTQRRLSMPADDAPHQPANPKFVTQRNPHTSELYVGPILSPASPMPHGLGEKTCSGVYQYRGHFENGLASGHGSIKIAFMESPMAKVAIHCSWEANRIDERRPAKIEYPNGDIYYGVITVLKDKEVPIEDFSGYIKSITVQRTGMGELCAGSHKELRYFGHWKADKRMWFGVQTYPDKARYYGQWDMDTRNGSGTMLNKDGSIYEGEWKRDEYSGPGTLFMPNGSTVSGLWKGDTLTAKGKCSINTHKPCTWATAMLNPSWMPEITSVTSTKSKPARWKPFKAAVQSGFHDERTRLEGPESPFLRIIHHQLRLKTPVSIECIQHLRPKDYPAVRPKLEEAILQYFTKVFDGKPKHVLAVYCSWFNRYFGFLYGSCGANDEIGAGPNVPLYKAGYFDDRYFKERQATLHGTGDKKAGAFPAPVSCSANTLIPMKSRSISYCHGRQHFGGCIHRGSRQKVHVSHLCNALDDISSFLYRLRECIELCFGETLSDLFFRKMDLSQVVLKRVNDAILAKTYHITRNLYTVVFAKQDAEIMRKLLMLRNVTLDDIGVSYGREAGGTLFQPYDNAISELSQLGELPGVVSKLKCLRKIATEIDQHTLLSQLKSSAINREVKDVIASHRKRAGSRPPEHIPEDTADATRASLDIDRVNTPSSEGYNLADESLILSGSMAVSVSRNSAALPPMSPSKMDIKSDLSRMSTACVFELNVSELAGDPASRPEAFEGGSADDLFPINLYIFIKAGLATCSSQLRFLQDFTSDSDLFDSSSDDAYRLATFQACMSYIQELDWGLRDANNVLIPVSVLEQRLVGNSINATGLAKKKGLAVACPQASVLVDSLPQLRWVSDVLLYVSGVSLHALEQRGDGKWYLSLPADMVPPQGYALLLNKVLNAIDLELYVTDEYVPVQQYNPKLAQLKDKKKEKEKEKEQEEDSSSEDDEEWTAMKPRWSAKKSPAGKAAGVTFGDDDDDYSLHKIPLHLRFNVVFHAGIYANLSTVFNNADII